MATRNSWPEIQRHTEQPANCSTYQVIYPGPSSFVAAGPTTWNNLAEYLRDPELPTDNFRRQLKLKTILFAQYIGY